MQVGIISDVHADYATLSEVIDRLDKHHKVDHILCAGDLVGRGPEPERVVQLMRANGITAVRGNHDDWAQSLCGETLQYVRGLPLEWRGQLAGKSVFMCHGKPGNNMWGMYRDHLSTTYLKMVLRSLKADVLVTGHTHLPLHMQTPYGCLVNPGSLYTFKCARASSRSYGVLALPELSFRVYDASARCGEPPIKLN